MAEWIRKGLGDGLLILNDGKYTCSNCGFNTDNANLKHCPRCGHETKGRKSNEDISIVEKK